MKLQATIQLRPDTLERLDQAKMALDRSRSWIVDRAVRDWLAAQQQAPATKESHPA